MAGKVGCALLLAVLFAAAAVSPHVVCGLFGVTGGAAGRLFGVVCPHTAPEM